MRACLQGVPYLILFEVKRRDFWENVCHHIATLGLIVYSYQLKCAQRDGMMMQSTHTAMHLTACSHTSVCGGARL